MTAATATVWAGVAVIAPGPPAAVLTWWCVCLACVDLGSRRLPDVLTGSGALVVSAHAVVFGPAVDMVVGAFSLFAVYLAVHLIRPRSFGAGDVKLAFALGALAATVGVEGWTVAALLAPLLTGVVGLVIAIAGKAGSGIAHGPSMTLATLLVLIGAGT